MFAEWIILGGLFFWILLLVASCFVTWAIECDSFPGAFWATVLFIAACICFGNIGAVVVANPRLAVGGVLAYVVAGMIWAVPRWLFLLQHLRRKYQKELREFKKAKKVPHESPIPPEHRHEWSERVRGWGDKNYAKYGMSYDSATGVLTPPSFAENAERLATWCVFWPWSVFWTILQDPVRWAIESFLEYFAKAFQRCSEWMFKDIA